jgi:hypothetical protein
LRIIAWPNPAGVVAAMPGIGGNPRVVFFEQRDEAAHHREHDHQQHHAERDPRHRHPEREREQVPLVRDEVPAEQKQDGTHEGPERSRIRSRWRVGPPGMSKNQPGKEPANAS